MFMPYKDREKRLAYHKKYFKEYYSINRSLIIGKKKSRKVELRKWMQDYKKTLKCELCPENNVACLEFHHLGEKERGISDLVNRGCSKTKIMGEIKKCQVLCSNCHRKFHYNGGNGFV